VSKSSCRECKICHKKEHFCCSMEIS